MTSTKLLPSKNKTVRTLIPALFVRHVALLRSGMAYKIAGRHLSLKIFRFLCFFTFEANTLSTENYKVSLELVNNTTYFELKNFQKYLKKQILEIARFFCLCPKTSPIDECHQLVIRPRLPKLPSRSVCDKCCNMATLCYFL